MRMQGQWADDRASGYGVFVYANGNRYDGQWLDDKRRGPSSSTEDKNYPAGLADLKRVELRSRQGCLCMCRGRGQLLPSANQLRVQKSDCQDGSVYDGEFAFGRKEGRCCLQLGDFQCKGFCSTVACQPFFAHEVIFVDSGSTVKHVNSACKLAAVNEVHHT